MTLVSREAEKCDRLGGFVALLSLAGGTGSGVGAYVTQCLRDEYPHAFILNQVVAPYHMGEVIVSVPLCFICIIQSVILRMERNRISLLYPVLAIYHKG